VRIAGGGGSGAFGTASVAGGLVTGITITDQGRGFTSIPTLTVDLPRFALRTDGFRTDFTGDVLSSTPEATLYSLPNPSTQIGAFSDSSSHGSAIGQAIVILSISKLLFFH
jgi:hypothetical protein